MPELPWNERLWDVAIIGAGMGGAFAAHALAKAGHDVLLIDYGNQDLTSSGSKHLSEHDARLAENSWPTLSAFEVDGAVQRSHAPFGAGVGGSTNLYAAALERFARMDVGGWPIGYDELLPYYETAERLLHVSGTQDPLSDDQGIHIPPPPALGPCDAHFLQFFEHSGLHPYRLHVGIRYVPGCDECLGELCHKNCRADARTVLAESSRKPTILARSEVIRLESEADRVTCAIVRHNNQQWEVRAKIFVLAAGAIHSPKLLLRSSNEHWPEGLANRSGLVGRNLMFHVIQSFVLWPNQRVATHGPRKSLSFRDFYLLDGQRYGSVQSTGFPFAYGSWVTHLKGLFHRSRFNWLRVVCPFLRIPAFVAARLLGPGTVFVGILEDLPYPENRVVLDDNEEDGVLVKYTIKQELRERTQRLRELLLERLQGRRLMFLSSDVELNFGHPCGTCVMSDDPASGVVDRDGRAHGLTNLFMADASFMPTSAATNPSLTVAANALRVAEKIDQRLRKAATAAASPRENHSLDA